MPKTMSATELEKKANELSLACDKSLNAILPIHPAMERRTALLIGRSPMFFSSARPKSEGGAWVISLHRKIFLLKELESKAEEIAALKAQVMQ